MALRTPAAPAGPGSRLRPAVLFALTLVLAAGLLATLPPEPAQAQSCPPAGGASIVSESAGDDDFVVTGRGGVTAWG